MRPIATARETASETALDGVRVLVVDDDPRICRLVGRISAAAGAESRALAAATGLGAVLDEFRPTVLFLDLNMARCDGVEALRSIAARGCEAAVVLMSGIDPRVLQTAHRLGGSLGLRMGEALAKPFTPAEVRSRLAGPAGIPGAPRSAVIETSPEEVGRALTERCFEPHFQPLVEAATARVVRIEALVRWRHPHHGLLAPARFLDAVERFGLMPGLTLEVLDRALACAVRLEREGHPLELAVNLSPSLLVDVEFPDAVHTLIEAHRWPARRLVLELTEHRGLDRIAQAMDVLARIRLKGIRLSLDDYGTGYSTVGQLYRLPFCELKIDKSFVMAGIDDPRAAAIVRSTLALARDDGLATVAEGVADRRIRNWAEGLGCELLQGHGITPPLDEEALLRWLRAAATRP